MPSGYETLLPALSSLVDRERTGAIVPTALDVATSRRMTLSDSRGVGR